MMRCRPIAIACITVGVMAGSFVPTVAAPTPSSAGEADPLKLAFDSLPEPDRRALQEALVWTGDFNGVVAGTFGPRTRDALLAHAKRTSVPAAAALDPPARSKILAEAEAGRRAVGFTLLRDPRSGIAIGLPLALLPLRSTLPAGTRYAAADSGITVETSGRPDTLDEVLARLTREAPGRRVTYKLSKPDFVVVSGEDGLRRFYSRSALGVAPGGSGVVRGFTLTYPKSAPDLDRVALAIAASFDPFPTADQPAGPTSKVVVPSILSAATGVLSGDAVLVGPGLALTVSDASVCPAADVGGSPVRWLRQDPASGLSLLALTGHAEAPSIALSNATAGQPDAKRLALFFVESDGSPVLSAAGVTRDGTDRIRAPLQRANAGAVLTDETGALSGLTAARRQAGIMVADIVAEARYRVIDVAAIAAVLKDAAVPTRPPGVAVLTPGEAVTRWRPVVLPLRCALTPTPSTAP